MFRGNSMQNISLVSSNERSPEYHSHWVYNNHTSEIDITSLK